MRDLAVAAPHDQLADQVVVVLADLVATLVAGVEANAEPVGWQQLGDRAGRRQELAAGGILGVDADLDRVAVTARRDLVLGHRQRLAGGDADLPLDEVDAGDHLGDRVLDLEPGVHLQEEELAVLVDELDGAGVVVADGLGSLDGGLAHRVLDAVGQARARAPPRSASGGDAGPSSRGRDPDAVALLVADDLDLDVARPGEVPLDVDLVASEERLGLALRRRHRIVDVVGRTRRPSCRDHRRRTRP